MTVRKILERLCSDYNRRSREYALAKAEAACAGRGRERVKQKVRAAECLGRLTATAEYLDDLAVEAGAEITYSEKREGMWPETLPDAPAAWTEAHVAEAER